MASSDDEGETFPDAVSEYYFSDGAEEPISFSKLPVQWNENDSESVSVTTESIFLRGNADNGLQKIYMQVKAWKFDISNANPEISVLSKDNSWVKLEKPRKSYQIVIRSILITVHCLYFCRIKPEASGKSLWDHLSKLFSSYDVRPSENDLIDHTNFIREAIKRDVTLSKSKFLSAFLENPRKRKIAEVAETATKPSFIVDDSKYDPQEDDFVTKQTEDSESDEEEDHFDSVCAICDNGGELTCCDGRCFRSFHATGDTEEAQDSNCESLCLRLEVLEGIQEFRCENCLYSRHQCFVCGKLGSSDKSSGEEVLRCSSATCGHFYHPRCVAELLHQDVGTEKQDLEKKIAAGEPFICPAHKCAVCKQTESERVKDLQFAICRRCPTSYHRKCLPREIMFEDQVDEDSDDIIRAWDNLLAKSRALIYCLNHEIDPDLGTPARTLKFRNLKNIKTEKLSEAIPKKKKKKIVVKERSSPKSQKSVEKSSTVKKQEDLSNKTRFATISGPEPLKKKKVADTSNKKVADTSNKKSLKRSLSAKVKTPTSNNNGQPSLGSRLFDYMQKGTESNNLDKDETSVDDVKQTEVVAKSLPTESLPSLDDDSKQRILALMKEAASSVTLDEVKKYHKGKVPSTHAHSSRVDKSIILARVEGSVEALHLALKKIEEGCSIEDAMAVCEPGVIDQIIRWKEKLRVYLSPFLHGMRYTSFGRHFTKAEKLEKIVDKLQWYVEDGDTVVDFCCGANDFSCLIKKRLDEMGKTKCSYRNFDITRPKNDFNFEKRDWMSVGLRELPSGSQLIMGLNPPFGKNATLANQFIEKALRFKPKLVVLIVPPETERLDGEKKRIPYDLVWEDAELLAGKSFYLPGSVDVNDKQMDQWNHTPPPLYLWSRPDWTTKHKSIAQKQGHIPQVQEPPHSDENTPAAASDVLNKKENKEAEDISVPVNDLPVINNKESEPTIDKPKPPDTKSNKKESPAHNNSETGTTKKQMKRENSFKQNSNKRNRSQEFKMEKRDDKKSRRDQPQKLDDKAPSTQPQLQPQNQSQKHADKPILAPSREDQPQKPDSKHFLAPSSRGQSQSQSQGQKQEDKRYSPTFSREDQAQKLDNKPYLAPYVQGQSQSQKHEDRRYPPAFSHEDQPQKVDTFVANSNQNQKHETKRYSPALSREEQPDNKHFVAPSTQGQSQGQGQSQKYEDRRYSPALSREEQGLKHDHNRSLTPTHEVPTETLHSDISFWNEIEPSFDQQLETRYNFNSAEPDFSFRNDVGPTFEPQFERRYNNIPEEPYVSSTYRQPDTPNLATSSYSMRPNNHLLYSGPPPGYERIINRGGSYYDDMNNTNTNTNRGGYPMTHHEPRYNNPADPAPYNRTSTSTTQRYAPRLDELNHTRVNNFGDEMNHTRMGGMGRSEPPPPMVSRGMGGYGPPPGFAPGPYNPYTQHNSSGGWLNE